MMLSESPLLDMNNARPIKSSTASAFPLFDFRAAVVCLRLFFLNGRILALLRRFLVALPFRRDLIKREFRFCRGLERFSTYTKD